MVVGQPGMGSEKYFAMVQAAINETGLRDRIALCASYVPDRKIADVLAAASFGILNTTAEVYSASGQVHLFAAHGLPLAVAHRPIYSDAVAAGCVPFEVSERLEWPTLGAINAVAALARSKGLREQVSAGMKAMARRTGWETIAERYRQLYGRLVK
jgi:glycosyltransferase involved in cell wall biosynthesis